MSLNQVIKIPAEQSSFDLSGAKNNVDFVLPSGAVYDLSRSYISITCEVKLQDSTGAELLRKGSVHMGNAIDGDGLTMAKACFIPNTAALISNAHLRSQNLGKISDIRQVGKYAFNKSSYKLSSEDFRNNVGKITPFTREMREVVGSQLEVNTYGDDISRERPHEIKIYLKDIFPYCNISMHDGDKHGNTSIHTEVKFDSLDFDVDGIGVASTATAPRYAGTANEVSGLILIKDMQNITVDTTAPDSFKILETKAKYCSKNQQPFYVGQQLKVDGILTAGAVAFTNTKTVVKIAQKSNDAVLLTLDSGLTPTAGGAFANAAALTAIEVQDKGQHADFTAFNINDVELVTEIVDDKPPPGQITYTTVLSEEDTYAANLAELHRVYEIPPMCKNIYIMFFKGGGIVSDDTDLSKYRLSIDNVSQSQTDVQIGSGEHYDGISRVFVNNGEALNSLSEKYFLIDPTQTDGLHGKGRNTIIAQPVPFLNRVQKLQVELYADTGAKVLTGRHIVYYDVVKQV